MPVVNKDQANADLFLKIFRFRDFHDPDSRDRLHTNTITIKPYPEKVSSDPSTGKLNLPVVGRVAW